MIYKISVGWMDGWMDGKFVLMIAYINSKENRLLSRRYFQFPLPRKHKVLSLFKYSCLQSILNSDWYFYRLVKPQLIGVLASTWNNKIFFSTTIARHEKSLDMSEQAVVYAKAINAPKFNCWWLEIGFQPILDDDYMTFGF